MRYRVFASEELYAAVIKRVFAALAELPNRALLTEQDCMAIGVLYIRRYAADFVFPNRAIRDITSLFESEVVMHYLQPQQRELAPLN